MRTHSFRPAGRSALALSVAAICVASAACVAGTADAPEDLGTLAIGGKADDPVSSFDVRVGPGRERAFRFDARGDLTIHLFQRDAAVLATLELIDTNGDDDLQVEYRDELGRAGESLASEAPAVSVTTGDASRLRELELVVRNPSDGGWVDGKIVFSRPVNTDCIAYERPDHTFQPLARCRTIVDPMLEAESVAMVRSVDLCVGVGQRVDWYDDDLRHDTLQVIGQYSYDDPGRAEESATVSLRDPMDLDSSDAGVLRASFSRTREVVTADTTLFGPEEERESREFEHLFAFDPDDGSMELRVRSRPDLWPNWYWEIAMNLACDPVD